MITPQASGQPLTCRERRQRDRLRQKAITVRPVRADESNPDLGIPAGSMVIVEELAPGIRRKQFVFPDQGEAEAQGDGPGDDPYTR